MPICDVNSVTRHEHLHHHQHQHHHKQKFHSKEICAPIRTAIVACAREKSNLQLVRVRVFFFSFSLTFRAMQCDIANWCPLFSQRFGIDVQLRFLVRFSFCISVVRFFFTFLHSISSVDFISSNSLLFFFSLSLYFHFFLNLFVCCAK